MRCCSASIPSTSSGSSWARRSRGELADGADERRLDPSTRALIERARDLMADFDLFVIGAGSGGVRASRVAAAYGARVAIAEEYKVGGTCVIRGCVPKKLLVYGAHFAEDLDDAAMFGWDVPQKRFDWAGAARQCARRGRPARGRLHRDADQPRRDDLPRAGGADRAELGAARRAARKSPPTRS